MAQNGIFDILVSVIAYLRGFGGWVVECSRTASVWLTDLLKIAWPKPLAPDGFEPRVSIYCPPSERQRVIDFLSRRSVRLDRPTFAAGTGLRLAA